uniref:Uncharacterized protein n=1 Tax=Rhizophora mucronata TaxID=61149 RepID=A0A2P2P440_RHIMU
MHATFFPCTFWIGMRFLL